MVLVTGGTGFLGAYIIKELVERNHAVRAIYRSPHRPFYIPASVLDRVEWVQGDLLDVISLQEAMDGVGAVIHAAAKVSFNPSERKSLYQTNIEGTANIVNIALEKEVRRLIHVSSVAAIGRTAGGGLVNEGKKWQESGLHTHYAISKYHAEMEVWRGMGEGLDVAVANPTTIIGYGDWNTSSCALFKNVYNEFPWYSNGINGFVDVADAARAIVLLLESDISRERFIINGDNWSFRQVFNAIAEGFGKKPPYREATPFLGQVAWRMEKFKAIFSGKTPLLTRETARIAQSKTRFDNSKIREALPDFAFTPLSETIREACAKYSKTLQPV